MHFTLQIKGQFWLRALLAAFAVLELASFALGTSPTIQIPRIETPPSLADFEDMKPGVRVAGQMVRVTGFIAREPADGAVPTQTTDVYLAYDQHNLYAVFVCFDNEPEKIRARMTRREYIFSDDSLELMVYTFPSTRRPY